MTDTFVAVWLICVFDIVIVDVLSLSVVVWGFCLSATALDHLTSVFDHFDLLV